MASSQSSTTSSVRERLPDNCFLNLSDDDEDTLEQLQSVENTFFSLGSIVEDPTVATQVVSDTSQIDNDGEVYDDMQNIEIEPSDEDIQYFKDIESFQQSGCGCSLLHGKKTIIFKFRGLQYFFLLFLLAIY